MAYEARSNSSFLRDFALEPRHWNFVVTCFEPLQVVTGGIGKYIANALTLIPSDSKILILTRYENKSYKFPANCQPIFVDKCKFPVVNNVGDKHDDFSLQCHFAFLNLYKQGHTFGYVEFSDYGRDGFFPLRAAKADQYRFDVSCIRLHSPDLMLIEDNGSKHYLIDHDTRSKIDRELAVYSDANLIAYGVESMRHRIVELCSRFDLDISAKLLKIPHPSDLDQFLPPELSNGFSLIRDLCARDDQKKISASSTIIGTIGRIESRKGQLQLISNILANPFLLEHVKNHQIIFAFAGKNVADQNDYGELRQQIERKGVADNFIFLGKLHPTDLRKFTDECDAFIFPSIFENYPNALLETLYTCKPTLISTHGGMPEITIGFDGVKSFDPLNFDPAVLLNFFEISLKKLPFDPHEFDRRMAFLNRLNRNFISSISSASVNHYHGKLASNSRKSLGFVIPVFNDFSNLDSAIKSCLAVGQGQDIVVVDDGSNINCAVEIERICKDNFVKYHKLSENCGPLQARISGCRLLSTELVQFCDADDLIDTDGCNVILSYLNKNDGVSSAVGVMACFGNEGHMWCPKDGSIWTAFRSNFSHSGSMVNRQDFLSSLDFKFSSFEVIEDWFSNLCLVVSGFKFHVVPVISYKYRRHGKTRNNADLAIHLNAHDQICQIAWDRSSLFSTADRYRKIAMAYSDIDNRTIKNGPVNSDSRNSRNRQIFLLICALFFSPFYSKKVKQRFERSLSKRLN